MWLKFRLYLVVIAMFAILYGIVSGIATWMGAGNFLVYAIIAIIITFLQYLLGPSLVGMMMRVRWVSEKEEPELHRMVAELARAAGIPKPKVGISQVPIPNAFAFGRSQSGGRVCVTTAIMQLLSRDELRAVLGHEISHLKHRDMLVITMLSVIPLILWYLAWSMMWGGMLGGRREGGGYAALIGLFAFLLYFITNLLVLYASRIREYYADLGSVKLGNPPHQLATALYKLVYGNARASRYYGQQLKQVEGAKAFFINDPSRAWDEVKELSQVDKDMSGTIDPDELLDLRTKKVKLGFTGKLMELLSTHPNMLKRIKHLSSLA